MCQNFGFEIYNIPYILEIEGHINIEILNKSLNILIERHPALRTGIEEIEGTPFQRVENNIYYDLIVKKASTIKSFNNKLASIIQEEINHNFNLNHPPLFKATLIEIESNKYILVFLFHHIISDEWSVGIFSRDLSSIYASYLKGSSPNLPTIESSYLKFSVWQKEWYKGEEFNRQLEYWKKQLNDYKLLDIPFERENKGEISKAGSYRFRIEEVLTKRLVELSNSLGSTLFITLLAIYKIVLYKIYNQEDIVVSSPISNRNYEEVENLIGCFVNIVMLRSTIESDDSFSTFLNNVKISALDAYDNQAMPFDVVIENLDQEEGYEKYFPQLFYEIKSSKNYALPLSGATTKWYNNLEVEYLLAEFDKKPSQGDVIDIEIEYSADLYNESTFSSIANNFLFIIDQVIANPHINISQIYLLDKEKNKDFICTLPSDNNKKILDKINKYVKFSIKEIKASKD